MQRTEPQVKAKYAGSGAAARIKVEAIVEALAHPRGRTETVAEVAHDARNMVTALGLYCDLLEEPGVLTAPYLHYGSELRLVAAASFRLVDKLAGLEGREVRDTDLIPATLRGLERSATDTQSGDRRDPTSNRTSNRTSNQTPNRTPNRTPNWDLMPAVLIDNLAVELQANRNLLAALAGPSVALTVNIQGSAMPVGLTGEDLTRVLVNLVKNSAEAMPAGGRMAFGLHEFHSGAREAPWLVLTLEDSGPGIPRGAPDAVFAAGYTTRAGGDLGRRNGADGQPSGGDSAGGDSLRAGPAGAHRGLGLSITRSIVEAAGGCMHAVHPAVAGARFEIELPVRQ